MFVIIDCSVFNPGNTQTEVAPGLAVIQDFLQETVELCRLAAPRMTFVRSSQLQSLAAEP